MTFISWPLFAQGVEGAIHTVFEWGRIQSNADWILPIGVCVAIMLFVRIMYRRDAVELHPLLGWFLTALRTATFLGLLILYLQPQWRSEREVIHNPRALLLVDTSLSMGLIDADTPPAGAKSRVQQVAAALTETDFIEQLRKTNDVAVLRFSEGLDRDRKSLNKLDPNEPTEQAPNPDDQDDESADDPIDWDEFLTPRGTETRLGEALRQLIEEESSSPVSGIVVFSDGGQNAGPSADAAVALAKKADIRIFAVGMGSDRKPTNVRVSDLVVPRRAYPGDSYQVTGFVQGQGMPGQVVDVELLSRKPDGGAGNSQPNTGREVAKRQVTLGGDGEVVPVKFELTPDRTGGYTLCFRVKHVEGDRPGDNYREADIKIVDHKNHALLLAGGPTREYRFLRTLLYRDESTTVDILLQTAQAGMSQEADQLRDGFPETREEMFDYDCLLAFDPDWQALSVQQVDLLEEWVAKGGGGLVVIAGPVYTANTISGWLGDRNMGKIRALYPVEFHRRFSTAEEGMHVAEEPWPLDFTREGLEAEFLWLDDTATAGRQAWAAFEGVFSFCPVRDVKLGATVLARFSDPRTGQGEQQPVFLATQFYGSGRVFYIGSGEMWRLRKLDPTYFDRFYTKLLRHVSQGRLLRGSSGDVLLVAQDRYLLGNTVEVRAQLTNSPVETQAPSVALQVVLPDSGAVQTVALHPDSSSAGTYTGGFPVLQEGSYRLELTVPDSNQERLTRRIQVNVPDLERENPQRRDKQLSEIAQGPDSDGEYYYVGLDAMLATTAEKSLASRLQGHPKIEYIPNAPDPLWEETWLRWMMLALCGLLCFEWLIRRLVKLA